VTEGGEAVGREEEVKVEVEVKEVKVERSSFGSSGGFAARQVPTDRARRVEEMQE